MTYKTLQYQKSQAADIQVLFLFYAMIPVGSRRCSLKSSLKIAMKTLDVRYVNRIVVKCKITTIYLTLSQLRVQNNVAIFFTMFIQVIFSHRRSSGACEKIRMAFRNFALVAILIVAIIAPHFTAQPVCSNFFLML